MTIKSIKKKLLIKALTQSLGVVTTACKKAKVSRQTFYNWIDNDPAFKKEVDDITEIALDFAESKLHELISENNVPAILFYLKTKGRKRGFIEKNITEVQGNIESKLIEWNPAKE